MSEKSIEEQIAEMMYVDPARALALHGEKVKSEVRGEYQQHQNKEKFWNDFYRQYPELQADHDEVFATLARDQDDLWNMPVAEATQELASRAKQHIKYKERHRAEERERSVYVGGPDGNTQSARGYDDGPSNSLSSLIKQRNAARSQGQSRFNEERADKARHENPTFVGKGKARTA